MSQAKFYSRIITDETLLENKQHGNKAFPLQYYYEDIWDFDFHCVDWHWHHELEYVYVQSGQAICFAGEEKMTVPAGYGFLINSRVIHRYEAGESAIIPNLVYSPHLLAAEGSLIWQKYFHPFMANGPRCLLFNPTIPWQRMCLQQMLEVFDEQEKQKSDEINTVSLLFSFWNGIFQHWHGETNAEENTSGRINQVRLQIMMQYIQEHYRENIRLEDIASAVHIGKSTALEIFSRGIHQSPIAYLIQYRLKQAALLLSSTEKKIARIAEETGFESSTYFCRKFKNLYGITPNDYRKSRR